MMCLVDLGTYCRFKGYWKIKDRIWSCVRSLSFVVCVCKCSYSALLVTPWLRGMAFYYHLFTLFIWVSVVSSTRAQSRGTRTLVQCDTSDRFLDIFSLKNLIKLEAGVIRGVSPCRKLGLAKCNAIRRHWRWFRWLKVLVVIYLNNI